MTSRRSWPKARYLHTTLWCKCTKFNRNRKETSFGKPVDEGKGKEKVGKEKEASGSDMDIDTEEGSDKATKKRYKSQKEPLDRPHRHCLGNRCRLPRWSTP